MTYEERKSRFMAAVRAEAMKQSEQINRSTEDYIEGELAKAEQELRYETDADVRSRITKLRREIGLSISDAQRTADAELYACRSGIEEEVFAEVRLKFANFRSTDAYDGYLAAGAELLNGIFGAGDSVTLYYMPGDEGRIDKIRKMIAARTEAVPSDSIRLGGFRAECAERKLAVDDTLDTALERQRERFRANPELRVDIVSG